MGFEDEFGADFLPGPVWVPDFPKAGSLEQAYLNAGKLPPPDETPGTMDRIGITYRGAFLEDLFESEDGLFTG